MFRFSTSLITGALHLFSTFNKPPLVLLEQKIKESHNPQIEMLYQLQRTHKVEKHITNKNVNELTVEEIYFYLTHKQIFARPSIQLKMGLLCNQSLSAYEKFLVAEHLPLLNESLGRKILIKSLNEHCRSMDAKQLIHCLRKMIDFNQVSDHLDLFSLSLRLAQPDCQIQFVEILYYTIYIDLNDVIINKQICARKLQAIQEAFIKSGRDVEVKYIYFLEYIQKELQIKIRNKDVQMRKSIIQRNINQMHEDGAEQGIKILDFYPQYLAILDPQTLNPQSYLRYLYYIKEHVKDASILQRMSHDIPRNIIPLLQRRQFISIITLRIAFHFDQVQDLGKLLKKLFTKQLECVQGIIEYLDTENIEDPQVWMDLQENFIKKLHMNHKKYPLKKLQQQFDVLVIVKILAKMNHQRLGSARFWKTSLRFMHDMLMDKEFLKQITQKNQNTFLYYCYEIYCGRAMQQHIQQSLKTLLLICLNENHWETNLLFGFIGTLSRGRIGDDEIWYAIQNKVLSLQLDRIVNSNKRGKVRNMVENFIQMRKGTFRFINKMSKVHYLKDLFQSQALIKEIKELQKDQ